MPGSKALKILIVDDQPIFIRGLASFIEGRPEYKIVGEALGRYEAVEIAKKEKPDLAIVEINLGKGNGMDIIFQLKSQTPGIAILVLSTFDERFYSERALRLGARGYIMKTEPINKVLDAIKTIASGKVYLSDPERERILEAMTEESQRGGRDWAISMQKLTDRELQIFSCISKGMGTIEIATSLSISTKTIDTHKEHLKLKLHCSSTMELRRLAIEWANHSLNP